MPDIENLINSPDESERKQAIVLLAKDPTQENLKLLVNVARADESEALRELAKKALMLIKKKMEEKKAAKSGAASGEANGPQPPPADTRQKRSAFSAGGAPADTSGRKTLGPFAKGPGGADNSAEIPKLVYVFGIIWRYLCAAMMIIMVIWFAWAVIKYNQSSRSYRSGSYSSYNRSGYNLELERRLDELRARANRMIEFAMFSAVVYFFVYFALFKLSTGMMLGGRASVYGMCFLYVLEILWFLFRLDSAEMPKWQFVIFGAFTVLYVVPIVSAFGNWGAFGSGAEAGRAE